VASLLDPRASNGSSTYVEVPALGKHVQLALIALVFFASTAGACRAAQSSRNTDAAITANASWNSVMDGMGRSSDYAGSAYVSQWYARNCYIFSNILSVTHSGDRVVVIMGQGHEYLLREFVRLNPALVAIDPLTYLNQ